LRRTFAIASIRSSLSSPPHVIGKLPLQWCLHPTQICAALWRPGLPFPFSNHSRARIFGGQLLALYALGVFSGNKVLEDTLQRREEVAVYDPDLTATQAQDIPSKAMISLAYIRSIKPFGSICLVHG
jgi:hypothetical protein